MLRWFFFVSLLCSLVLSGCLQTQFKYVCSDGRVMNLPQDCFSKANSTASSGPAGSLLPEPTLPVAGQPSITPPSNADLAALEQQTLLDINAVRAENGLPALKWNERAASADRKYAEYLVTTGQFAHTADAGQTVHDRLNAEGLTYFLANENLAEVSFNGTLPTAQSVVDGWMQSPGHRSNIIDVDHLYSHAGIGVFCGQDVCVFDYSAVSLRRSSSYSLDQNYYSYIYVNDPGFGFGKTVPALVTLSNVSGLLDAFVLPNSSVFDQAKALTPTDFAARRFPYLQSFENTQGFASTINASVGTGIMAVNNANGPTKFVLTVELTGG